MDTGNGTTDTGAGMARVSTERGSGDGSSAATAGVHGDGVGHRGLGGGVTPCIQYSPTRRNLMKARLAAQAEMMKGAVKNRDNPFAKSKYATLDAVLEAVAAPLTENGLVLTQWCGDIETMGAKGDRHQMTVYTQIEHAETTEWMLVSAPIPIVKLDAQGIGSAITYGRRYGLKPAVGMPEVDDDGAAASGQESELRPKRKSSAEAKRDGTTDIFNDIRSEISQCINVEMLRHVGEIRREQVEEMPDKWQTLLREDYETKMSELKAVAV